MAQLIVTRPRLGYRWDVGKRFDVLIDGKRSSADRPRGNDRGRSSARPSSGRRAVRRYRQPTGPRRSGPRGDASTRRGNQRGLVQITWPGLDPVHVAPRWIHRLGPHRLAVIFGTSGDRRNSDVRSGLAEGVRSSGRTPGRMPLLTYVVFLRNHSLILTEVPDPDLTVEQIAELLRARPVQVRITIWHLMIAIALLALGFWISLEVFRSSRASLFDSQARLHANRENSFREEEQRWVASDISMEKRGWAGATSAKRRPWLPRWPNTTPR